MASQQGKRVFFLGISVYYHTHWDREWYWPMRRYQVRLAEVVDDILDRLETGILPCFMLDGQAVVLEDYLELRPENRERLARLIEDGRLAVGPWYVAPDEFLVGGESLIRNLRRGIEISRAWGWNRFTGYLPDTFGHSADMPSIFQGFGINTAVVWRGVNPEKSLFRWQSANGAEVLTYHLTEGYFQMMLQDKELQADQRMEAVNTLVRRLQEVSVEEQILMPIGADHLGPLTKSGYTLLRETLPEIRETTPDQFLSDLAGRMNGQLPRLAGELVDNSGSFLLPGVYSARLYLKKMNRRLEHELTRMVEPMLALAKLVNPQFRYPVSELDLAWKTLILNHPHDSICGCSVDEVHRENEVRYEQVAQLAGAMRERAQAAVLDNVAPNRWMVFNMLDQTYSGVIPAVERVDSKDVPTRLMQVGSETEVLLDRYLTDSQDLPLSHLTQVERHGWCWVQDVPAMGWQMLDELASDYPVVTVTDGKLPVMEHDGLKLQVMPDGTLTATDKKTGREYQGLHQLWNQPEQGDSYNSAPVPGTQPQRAVFKGAALVQRGPVLGAVRLTYEVDGIVLETQVYIKSGCQRFTFETTFTNQQPDHKVQVLFPTGAPVTTVQAENHFSIVERHYDPDYREADHMPVAKNKELKTNTGPIQRFISANGHTLFTEGLTEYEVKGESIALTLLRAFGYLSKGDTGARGAQAGPPFATPEGQCLNRPMSFRYSWRVTPPETERLYRFSDNFYLVAGVVQREETKFSMPLPEGNIPETYSLISWDNPTVVRTACHWEPSVDGLVLRLLNPGSQAQPVTLAPGFSYDRLLQTSFLLEEKKALSSPQLTLAAGEIVTLLFQNARHPVE